MQLTEEFIQKEAYRADCYKLLSACFCKPGQEFIEEKLIKNLISALKPVCSEAVPFAKNMEDDLSKYKDIDKELDVLIDYSALFIGPFKLLAPPYGSCYLEDGRRVMGDTTIDAINFYRKAGVEMDRDNQGDIPDHIAVELEFMYYLISKGLEAYQNSNEKEALDYFNMQENFLKKHLGAWIEPFAKDMKKGAKSSFYQNLADCTLTFVKSDKEYLMTKYGAKGRA